MPTDSKKGAGDDTGEFAEFMAEVSQEIAQRVESLNAAPKAQPEPKKATPVSRDAGLILEWENLADRMIEEMR
jgi:hypothetical protein